MPSLVQGPEKLDVARAVVHPDLVDQIVQKVLRLNPKNKLIAFIAGPSPVIIRISNRLSSGLNPFAGSDAMKTLPIVSSCQLSVVSCQKRIGRIWPVCLAATMFLALPANEALAQKGGRGGGGGGHVGGGGVHVGGGGVRVGSVSSAGVRSVGVSPAHISRPGGPVGNWNGHVSHPIHNGNNGWGGGVGIIIGGGSSWWPGPYFYDGYYGGGGTAVYNNYQSYYPPSDVFSLPQQGGGYSGTPMLPADVLPNPKTTTALVVVMVPTDDAELWFNGAKTQTRGQKREFLTPELPPGQVFSYEIKIRWNVDGKDFERSRTVSVQAGAQSIVNFLVEGREQLPAPVQVGPPVIKM
jgi:uncharacterized protein (TIGR03000 family)